MDPYNEAHVFVAAIRIIQHNSNSAAAIDEVCKLLEMSTEAGLSVCRKLEKSGIVEILEDPFSLRVSIRDHLAIEKLPKQQKQEDTLAQELQAFKAKKQDMDKKVESIQAELTRKRESMFSDIEKKLKGELGGDNK